MGKKSWTDGQARSKGIIVFFAGRDIEVRRDNPPTHRLMKKRRGSCRKRTRGDHKKRAIRRNGYGPRERSTKGGGTKKGGEGPQVKHPGVKNNAGRVTAKRGRERDS